LASMGLSVKFHHDSHAAFLLLELLIAVLLSPQVFSVFHKTEKRMRLFGLTAICHIIYVDVFVRS